MKVKQLAILVILVSKAFFAPAQIPVPFTLEFHPVFGSTELKCDDTWFKLSGEDSIKPEVLRFYISAIELLNNEKIVWKEESGFYLVDAAESASLKIELNLPAAIKFNKIKFNLGIDSVGNVSGAMGGVLDPTHGMYWTWQSGYINFKLEGKSNRCKSRNNEFQYHLGGYQYPNNALRTAVLDVGQKTRAIILVDIEQFISEADLVSLDHIMSPGKPAMELSDTLIKAFSIQ